MTRKQPTPEMDAWVNRVSRLNPGTVGAGRTLARPGISDLTAPDEGVRDPPRTDEGLVTLAYSGEPWAPQPQQPSAAPAEPTPNPKPAPGPVGPSPSVRPPVPVPPIGEPVPVGPLGRAMPAVRVIGGIAIVVVGGALANAMNDANFSGQVLDALKRYGLDPLKPNDVRAAQAFVFTQLRAPSMQQFWKVPSSGADNRRVAEALMRAVQTDPDLIDRIIQREPAAAEKLKGVIQEALHPPQPTPAGAAAAGGVVPGTGSTPIGQPDDSPAQPRQAPVEVPPPPVPGVPPQPAPPLAVPDFTPEHDPNDPDEAELVSSMRGRPGTEIQNALAELRARKRGQGAGSTGAGTPPGEAARAPVNATPDNPDHSPSLSYPGPDMTPMDGRERGLVDRLKREHASDDDIRKALAESRARHGPAQAASRRGDRRNEGLPDDLTTGSNRARQNVYDGDQRLRDAITRFRSALRRDPNSKPDKPMTWSDFVAHHLIPMEMLRSREFRTLFEAAARAGWSPDEVANLLGLPKNAASQRRMEGAMGERRPIHDSGHSRLNKQMRAEMNDIRRRLEASGLRPGPEFDQEVRRQLEELQNRRRQDALRRRRLTMGEGQQENAA